MGSGGQLGWARLQKPIHPARGTAELADIVGVASNAVTNAVNCSSDKERNDETSSACNAIGATEVVRETPLVETL